MKEYDSLYDFSDEDGVIPEEIRRAYFLGWDNGRWTQDAGSNFYDEDTLECIAYDLGWLEGVDAMIEDAVNGDREEDEDGTD